MEEQQKGIPESVRPDLVEAEIVLGSAECAA